MSIVIEGLRLVDAAQTRQFGKSLAKLLQAGDVLVAVGGLGAGKTTFTQGLGEGLNVRGPIASPTFIIARSHPPLAEGPWLIHVDAYRLNSLQELDHLDLDATVDEAITVVEWGRDSAERLSDAVLIVTIERPRGQVDDVEDPAAGDRVVTIEALGDRWAGVDFSSLTSTIEP